LQEPPERNFHTGPKSGRTRFSESCRRRNDPKKATAPAHTDAAPPKVVVILEILRKTGEWKARAAVALMFFAGLAAW